MAERRQLFISCEHGGNQVPAYYQAYFLGQKERLASHQGYDPGALPLARMLARELASPLKKSETTRLLVDLNRSRNSRTLFSDISRRLDQAEKVRLITEQYLPYREQVTEKINSWIVAGAQVVHLSVHSFTPVLYGTPRNADVGLLYNPGRIEEKRFCQAWKRLLKQRLPELRIRANYPYRGTADGLVSSLRGLFNSQDYLGIELELNQAQLGAGKRFPHALQSGLLETLRELFPSD